MMKRITAFVLPLLFLSLMMIQAGALVVTPCEADRLKDVCFIRVRGDYQTQSFLTHYVSLSPAQQEIAIARFLWTAPGTLPGVMFSLASYTLAPGESIDLTTSGKSNPGKNLQSWFHFILSGVQAIRLAML